ncbi:MAG: endonuclease/exonuclease/phosphatase family protein [Acidimicrobiales bacterium]|nr:endonuclease/exonuclease/phosphatase family protein [Acidimicrobiales bacterium]
MRIATLNLRNTSDRWPARRALLVRQLVALAPDVIAVQELRMVPDQARWITGEVARRSGGRLVYRACRRPKTGAAGLWEGIGVLSRLPVVSTGWLDLRADRRVAQRVTVRGSGGTLDVYNAHLGLGGEVLRSAQAQLLIEWMDGRRPGPAVLMGDLNARPGSPTIELLSRRFRSAHVAVHGCEPPFTVPTPLRVGAAGVGSVLDYVFVNDLVEVAGAKLAFDEIDGPLCASDHYGLVADVTLLPETAAVAHHGRG